MQSRIGRHTRANLHHRNISWTRTTEIRNPHFKPHNTSTQMKRAHRNPEQYPTSTRSSVWGASKWPRLWIPTHSIHFESSSSDTEDSVFISYGHDVELLHGAMIDKVRTHRRTKNCHNTGQYDLLAGIFRISGIKCMEPDRLSVVMKYSHQITR